MDDRRVISGILHVLKVGCCWRDCPREYEPATTRQLQQYPDGLPLLETIASPKRLLADRAYDADSQRNWLKARRVKSVIPSSRARTVPYPYNRRACRGRNVIERLFCRLKNWRRIATRYNRLAANYLAGVALVAAVSE